MKALLELLMANALAFVTLRIKLSAESKERYWQGKKETLFAAQISAVQTILPNIKKSNVFKTNYNALNSIFG